MSTLPSTTMGDDPHYSSNNTTTSTTNTTTSLNLSQSTNTMNDDQILPSMSPMPLHLIPFVYSNEQHYPQWNVLLDQESKHVPPLEAYLFQADTASSFTHPRTDCDPNAEFEVHAITGRRWSLAKQMFEYRVHWSGYLNSQGSEDTWEPEIDLQRTGSRATKVSIDEFDRLFPKRKPLNSTKIQKQLSTYIIPIATKFIQRMQRTLEENQSPLPFNNKTFELLALTILQTVEEVRALFKAQNQDGVNDMIITTLDLCFKDVSPINLIPNDIIHTGTMNWVILLYLCQLNWVKSGKQPSMFRLVVKQLSSNDRAVKIFSQQQAKALIDKLTSYSFTTTYTIDFFWGCLDPLYCLALEEKNLMQRVVDNFHRSRLEYANTVLRPHITSFLEESNVKQELNSTRSKAQKGKKGHAIVKQEMDDGIKKEQ